APGNNFPPLSNPNAVNPTFTLATTGTYIAQLIVCNAYQCSDPATVTISTQLLPPTANAGSGQTVNVGTPVNLSGLASSDPQNLPLTYSWSI
ncbi:PKD domain-containing protein, partial [Salmonella enterica]|uniref:PKD domain-containing protein n=1 Tax=Salmonella enterica TaxID=28901 RepID=UPI0020A4420F